jgi:PilZ domain
MIRKLAKERRKKKRGPISVPVKYNGIAEISDEKRVAGEGTTADVSNEGIGFFSDKEIAPGTVLEIECDDVWATPRQFTVKWCDRIQYNFFRMGLEVRD